VLTLLRIKNIALIDELAIEFGAGLNLLTGETGSGKSIIVDSLGALTGARISNDLIKEGQRSASIEGLFTFAGDRDLLQILDESGIEIEQTNELIVRRELSTTGKNRIFINGQLVTQNLLKRIGAFLVDIHGQGEQAAIYDVDTHISILDDIAGVNQLKKKVAEAFSRMANIRSELAALQRDSAEKLQLVDVLRFQTDEIDSVKLRVGEDVELEDEKRRLNNVEKLTALSDEAFSLLYDDQNSTSVTLEKANRKIGELAEFDPKFHQYSEGISAARAVIDDLAAAVRDLSSHLEFSPERLEEIEDRLAAISRLKRKYGGTIESVIEHLRTSEDRLQNIETAEFRENELKQNLSARRAEYLELAHELHAARVAAAKRFERQIEQDLKAVSLEKAQFEVRIEKRDSDDSHFTENGFDQVEFYFTANPGESPKSLARVASGGEASRLMLILKTVAKTSGIVKTIVFDEIDVGIGGRVSEAVGRKLKGLSASQQVLCVTHQPQIASLADRHFVVEKVISRGHTIVSARELTSGEQVEELARMLAGELITDQARENARAMLASAK